jgi:hypothetical protein
MKGVGQPRALLPPTPGIDARPPLRRRHRISNRTFHSLAEVNAAIAELLTRLNEERPIGRLGVTRRKLLEEIDRTADKSVGEKPREPRLCAVPRAIYDRLPQRRR